MGRCHEFRFGQVTFKKRTDILLRKMVLEACERGEVGYEFRGALADAHKDSSG